jgi:DNA-binding MarR family transcriptional regulator
MKTTARIAELLDRLNRLLRNDVESSPLKPVQWEVLRFLYRANRFSRTPGAVTAWLGITKGTVSQSLSTLERDGFIKKLVDVNDKRIVRLAVTASGKRLLAKDPLEAFAACLEYVDPIKLRTIEGVFEDVLHMKLEERDHVKFGICHTCKHFQIAKEPSNKHHCGLLNVKLNEEDIVQLCVEHT